MANLPSAWKSFAIAGAACLSIAPIAHALPEADATLSQTDPVTLPGEVLPDADIVTVASSIDDFSTLVQALETAGLADDLMGDGPFTVFAPTNEAFADLDNLLQSRYDLSIQDLLEPENRPLLTDVLTYHVVPGAEITSGDIPNGVTVVDSLEGGDLQVNRGGNDINVNSVPVTAFDVPASNGVIHVVEYVLLPPEVIATLEEYRDVIAAQAEGTVTRTETPTTVETTPAPTQTQTTTPATTAPATTTEAAPAEPVRGLW